MQYDQPICLTCRHFRDFNDDTGLATCTAYPEEIPEEIITSRVDHHEPYRGDHGIQYEPKEEPQI